MCLKGHCHAAEGATGPRKRSGKRAVFVTGALWKAGGHSRRTDGVKGRFTPARISQVPKTEGGQSARRLSRALIVGLGGILLKTPLDRLHRELGARMVAFAGYEMPLQYQGIIVEHMTARQGAALFDVSHMGQAEIVDATAFEALVTGDVAGLKAGRQRYTLLTNASGGIIDDLMVANLGDRFQLVLNAGRKDFDVAHMRAHGVAVETRFGRALLALQGPNADRVLPEGAGMTFMDAAAMDVAGIACIVTRSGYTGEDGFEIGCAAADAEALMRLLLGRGATPAGLGARDSLRLEAGLPLYGNDIGEETNPVAAGLDWAISKRRRESWNFLGGDAVRETLENGPAEKLVGIKLTGRAAARAGAEIRLPDGQIAGRVTSGCFSPSLDAPVSLGYVRADAAAAGLALDLIVRDKPIAGVVTKLPFIPHRYVR